MSPAQSQARVAAAALPHDDFERIDQPVVHWARHRPDAPAVSEGDLLRSYAELAADIERAAAFLTARGVQAGDRILVIFENGLAGATLLLAAARTGAWVVPLNARLSAREIETIRAHARPRMSLYAVGNSAEAAAHAARDGASGAPGLESLCVTHRMTEGRVEPEPDPGPPSERVAALIYTSGTTGAPKAVMLTHGNLLFMARRNGRVRGLGPSDRVYGVSPISHVFGLTSIFLSALYRGARIDLVPRFRPEEAARALADDGITVFQAVPAIYPRLLSLAAARGAPLAAPELRYASAGGAPLDLGLKREVQAMFGILLHNGYGLTETSPTVSITAMDGRSDDDSVGVPLPDVEIVIVDRRGARLPVGETGELWVRGGLVMKGYYRDPEGTAEVLTPEGWLKTGDLARLSDDGRLYIVGRVKELIIRSGFNVYPAEVEGVIAGHPDVALVAVVGRPKDGNEEVVAFVQPRPGSVPDPEALAGFAAGRLAPYKRPVEYILRDQLPATAAGKILKHELKQELEAVTGPTVPGGRA